MNAGRPRAVFGATLIVGLLVGGRWVMQETLTRHEDVPPGSTLEVELTVRAHTDAEAAEASLAEALVSLCQLEVGDSSVVPDSFTDLGGHRYRFVLDPSLDDSDRQQLHGCLQDLRIDHFLAHVESMTERDLPAR